MPRVIIHIILILSLPIILCAQDHILHFKHLTYSQGLTNSNAYTFCQDSRHFMWIGTEGGLFRYDGFHFKHYKSDLYDSTAISSNLVFSLLNDSKNNLWIGTYEGLMRYVEELDNFIDYKLSDHFSPGKALSVNGFIEIKGKGIYIASSSGIIVIDPLTQQIDKVKTAKIRDLIGAPDVKDFLLDSENTLWIATENGLLSWDFTASQVKKHPLSKLTGKVESNIVVGLHEDQKKNLWISTRGGGVLQKVNKTGKYQVYLHDKTNPHSIGSNECYDFWESSTGRLWITTNGGGINIFNRDNNSFDKITAKASDKHSLLNNNTRTVYEDHQGNLWISSFQAGINILINTPYNFNDFSIETQNDLQSTTVISFYLEDENTLWIGTDGDGLKRINRSTKEIETFHPMSDADHFFPDKVVMNIHKDKSGKLWMGTYLEGVIEFDPKTYTYKQYKHNPENPNSISNNYVSVIHEDKKGNLWVGTNGGGLNLFDRNNNRFVSFMNDPEKSQSSLINNFINVIEEDKNGDLWIGTYWGLSRFNTTDHSFSNYQAVEGSKDGLNDMIIYSLLHDSEGQLWIGTRTGLYQYNFEQDDLVYYHNINGISNNQITGILDDPSGDLWIATDNGITRFNPATQKIRRYFEEDGLQGNEFFRNSCHKGFNGELFFGGYKGFNSFFAQAITDRVYKPRVVLTSLRIMDQDITIGKLKNGKTILSKNITLTDEITLDYFDRSFTVGFSAIDFIEGNKIEFLYRLDDFDTDWNRTNANIPFASYTNLNPGKYILRIKASKPELIHQTYQETVLAIHIKPPIWATWFAYSLYATLLLLIVIYFWRLSLLRVKERNEIKLEKYKREQTEAISQARMQFFTNISHEVRTPLSLILGPLEKLLALGSEMDPYRRYLDIMTINARRLHRLVNQLLDLRKIELEKMKLLAEHADIITFIKNIVFSFEELALDKKIDFKLTSNINSLKMWFDPDKMDKIIFNLLSNAFKYTPAKGEISIIISSNTDHDNNVSIIIKDNGIGIDEKDLPHIFDRFYQTNTTSATPQQGWGIGLAITQTFVQLHHGEIYVESVKGIGTTFKIYLPADDTHLSAEEKIIDIREPGMNKYIHLQSPPSPKTEQPVYTTAKKPENPYQVLIVEDNQELCDYLLLELEHHFDCHEASDGKIGLDMAMEIMPDLIISDVVMPHVTGVELCRSVKQNIVTRHIPVILLTAKNEVEHQIEGFESGADAYIPKPFNVDSLVANINSILENRRILKERLSTADYATITHPQGIKSADDKFLKSITDTILEQISNPQLNVEELAQELGMSRSHLHRKMKAIVNLGPNEYIRKIRLEKAAEILLQGEMNISEVSFEVGFSSISYFSSSFKAYFSISPKAFIDKHGAH